MQDSLPNHKSNIAVRGTQENNLRVADHIDLKAGSESELQTIAD